MTRVDFYHYAEDKLRFACRLAATAFERGSPLVVFSPNAQILASFDRLLWTYQSTRFVPHCRAGEAIAPETPVILAESEAGLTHHEVLLNLGDEWPPFFASFERLLEIVGKDEDDKQRARGRFAFYKKRGYDIRINAIAEG